MLGVDTSSPVVHLHVEKVSRPVGCPTCGVVAQFKGWREVVLIDLPAFGKPTRLHWHKRRWRCDDPDCAMGSWTEQDRRIAAPRMAMTDRAGRWVTAQVGRCARSVAEVAKELGCDWHTVNDAVVRYGEALVEHPGRFGDVSALGLDEVLFVRRGRYRRQEFATSIADVRAGQLLDVVPGRHARGPAQWLYDQGLEFYRGDRVGNPRSLGSLSGRLRRHGARGHPGGRSVPCGRNTPMPSSTKPGGVSRTRPSGTVVARPTRSIGSGACSPRPRNDSKTTGREKLVGLLRAGDPRGEVATTWRAKEAVRELYAHGDEATAHGVDRAPHRRHGRS